MYRSFQAIDDFIKEVYGFDFTKRPMDSRVAKIKELGDAYNTIMKINRARRRPLSKEFIKYVYPLLGVAAQWDELKKKGKLTRKFLEKCKKRVKTQSNFYGTIFEIDMASRFFLSNWYVDFPEDYTEEGKQIDFVVYKGSKQDNIAGVECTSKRRTDELTVKKVNKKIGEKAKKFEPEYIENLDVSLDEKLLVIDVTRVDYTLPKILKDLGKIRRSSKLDAVIFTWREDIKNGENHSLIAKYKTIGDVEKGYFSITPAVEIRTGDNGSISFVFVRKYIESEPAATVGTEETVEGYVRNKPTKKLKGQKNKSKIISNLTKGGV